MENDDIIYKCLLVFKENPRQTQHLIGLIQSIDNDCDNELIMEHMKDQELVKLANERTSEYFIIDVNAIDWFREYQVANKEKLTIHNSWNNRSIILTTIKVLKEKGTFYNPKPTIWRNLSDDRKDKIIELLLQVIDESNRERIIYQNQSNTLEIQLTTSGQLLKENDFSEDGIYMNKIDEHKQTQQSNITAGGDIYFGDIDRSTNKIQDSVISESKVEQKTKTTKDPIPKPIKKIPKLVKNVFWFVIIPLVVGVAILAIENRWFINN